MKKYKTILIIITIYDIIFKVKTYARITGNQDVHDLSVENLCTTNSEISEHTNIKHA